VAYSNGTQDKIHAVPDPSMYRRAARESKFIEAAAPLQAELERLLEQMRNSAAPVDHKQNAKLAGDALNKEFGDLRRRVLADDRDEFNYERSLTALQSEIADIQARIDRNESPKVPDEGYTFDDDQEDE